MSEEISTLERDVIIRSIFHNGNFHISAYRKGEEVAKGSWTSGEYGALLKSMWESYINTKEKPKLLGQRLADDGLVAETLRYVAPSSFYKPENYLDEERGSFARWLESKSDEISSKISRVSFDYLYSELSSILRINSSRTTGQGTNINP